MKLLTILFLLIFISCEQTTETEVKEDGSIETKSNITPTDISSDYFGDYISLCHDNSSLEFGQGRIVELTLDSGSPTLVIKEYGEVDCRTITATRSYSLDAVVETTSTTFGGVVTTSTDLSIEYLSSNLMLNHSAYAGYWDCGFTASIDINYPLNSSCLSNLDGNTTTYKFEDLGSNQFRISNYIETITLTKQ
jgi:hypothetical protein